MGDSYKALLLNCTLAKKAIERVEQSGKKVHDDAIRFMSFRGKCQTLFLIPYRAYADDINLCKLRPYLELSLL